MFCFKAAKGFFNRKIYAAAYQTTSQWNIGNYTGPNKFYSSLLAYWYNYPKIVCSLTSTPTANSNTRISSTQYLVAICFAQHTVTLCMYLVRLVFCCSNKKNSNYEYCIFWSMFNWLSIDLFSFKIVKFDNSNFELFRCCILQNRKELALLFWEQTKVNTTYSVFLKCVYEDIQYKYENENPWHCW